MNFPDPATLDQAPDLVLTAAKGFDFEDEDTGPVITPVRTDHLGHHGALETDPDTAIVLSLMLLLVSITVLVTLRDKWLRGGSTP